MNEWVAVLAFQSVTYNTLSQLLCVLDLRIGQPQGVVPVRFVHSNRKSGLA